MKIHSISSESNTTLKTIRSLHKRQAREKERLFVLEGSHCLIEAIKSKLDLKSIVASQSYLQEGMEELRHLDIAEISVLEDKMFCEHVSTASNCGVLAVAKMPKEERSNLAKWQPKVIAVLDAIQDPGNLGTLIRTAFAAELGGLLLLKGTVDRYNPKVVRSASGALFSLPVISDLEQAEAVEMLKSAGYRLVIAEANAKEAYFDADLKEPVAIVLGNEGQGVGSYLKESADESISIPMNPLSESLNVAISGGIILFEAARQRRVASRT